MLSRRSLLAAAGLSTLAVGLGGCGTDDTPPATESGARQTTNLDVFWWGGDSTARTTNGVLDLYNKRFAPSTAKGQFLSYDDYFNKLATLAAAKQLPDVLALNGDNITKYAQNGLLLDLTGLDLGDYKPEALKTGAYEGKQYGINFGYEFEVVMYNTELLEKSELTLPKDGSDWNAWGDFASQLTSTLGDGTFGLRDCTGGTNEWLSWLISRGKEGIWAADGSIGFDATDAHDWFTFWADLRQRGAVPPGPQTLAAAAGGAAGDPLTKGKAVMSMATITQFEGFQALTKTQLGLATCPTGTNGRGEWSSFYGFAVSAATKSPQAAKDLLHLWFTDDAAFAALGFDHGIPASQKQLDVMAKDAKGSAKTVLDFMNAGYPIAPISIPASPAKLGSKFDVAFAQASESVLSGSSTVDKAVDQFMSDSEEAFAG